MKQSNGYVWRYGVAATGAAGAVATGAGSGGYEPRGF